MSKLQTRCYRLFGNVLIICCEEINIMYEKCDTSKIFGIGTVNMPTCSSAIELDADRKNQKLEKCLAA